MATEVLKTFSALQDELLKAREGLRSVDDNIKRIIGRDPEAPAPVGGPPRPGQKRPAGHLDDFQGRGRGFPFPGRGGRITGPGHGPMPGHGPGHGPTHGPTHGPSHGPGRPQDEDGPVLIRRRLGDKTVFSRLSGPPLQKYIKKEEEEDEGDDDDLQHKPAISSRVIPQVRELPTKEDIIAAQGDERSKARNRRMFGALLGTLQKFRQEETMMRDREDKKAQVEKKLEEAAKREKEELKKERYELFQDRRRKQQEIRRIEFKIQRVKEQDQWEARHRPLLNFIQTKTKPPIFYLPKIHNSKTEERLVASQKVIARMMEKKRSSLQEELDRFENRNETKAGTTDAQQFGEEEEDEIAVEGPEQPSESPPENKENRLRSVNVKIEKEVEQKVTLAGKIVRPESENKSEPDKKLTTDRHDEQRRYNQRDRRDHHSKSRDSHPEGYYNDRGENRDHSRDRGKAERGRPRERDRPREKRSDSGDQVEVKEEQDEKWNRKRDDEESNDAKLDSVERDLNVPGAELSSISLPGEGDTNDNV